MQPGEKEPERERRRKQEEERGESEGRAPLRRGLPASAETVDFSVEEAGQRFGGRRAGGLDLF